MIRSREVIPLSLEHALVANRVLAALASSNLASEESQEAVQDGIVFLNSMLEGGRLTASRSVSAGSYKPALAYGEGVRAFELVAYQDNVDPVAYLNDLVGKAVSLRVQPQERDEQAVGTLARFFRTVRDLALASGDRPVERVL